MVTAGEYDVEVEVTYSNGDTEIGTITIEVAEAT